MSKTAMDSKGNVYTQTDFLDAPQLDFDDYVRPSITTPQAPAPAPVDVTPSYLWVNITDIHQMGNVPLFGNALESLLTEDDTRLPGAWWDGERLDNCYVIVETSKKRAKALQEALEVIGKQKIKRPIRMKVTDKKPAGKKWQYTPEPDRSPDSE